MLQILLIFIGCGLGGLLRYLVFNSVHLHFGSAFPCGTLVVNISGSFLMGLLFVILSTKFPTVAVQLRALLLIGLLGGYTTFSSFSMETLILLESGELLFAGLNIILSLLLSILAAYFGVLLGRLC